MTRRRVSSERTPVKEEDRTARVSPGYELADLLRGVTESNLHGEVRTGDTLGREIS